MITVQNNLALHPALPKAPTEPKKRTAGDVLKKICRQTVNILSCGKLCSIPNLTAKEVKYIQRFKHTKLYGFPAGRKIGKVKPGKYNESLEGMRSTAKEFMGVVEICLQKKIKPHVDAINKASEDLPNLVKDIAKEAISIGTLTAKPLFEIINKFQFDDIAKDKMYKVLDWALKERKEEAQKELIKRVLQNKALGNLNEEQLKQQAALVINWLFNTDHAQPIQNLFEVEPKPSQALVQQLQQSALLILAEKKEGFKQKLLLNYVPDPVEQQNNQQLNACVDKILDWLFNSDHKAAPDALFENEPNPPSEKLVNGLLQSTFQILANEKIDTYKDKTNLIFQNKLPALVEKAIHDNAVVLTDVLSDRIAEVIDHMGDEQFTVLFDKIIEITAKHVTNITKSHEQAEEIAQEHAALKRHAIKMTKMVPKNDKEEIVRRKCEEYLANLARRGSIPAIKEDVLLKTFLILNGNEVPGIDRNVAADISKLIIDTLLPPMMKDGKEIKGLENLLSKIQMPEEFTELVNEAKEIAEMIITPEEFEELHDIADIAVQFKNLAFEGVEEVIRMGLNEAIEIVIKQMSKPEELNLVITKSALPSAMESMIRYFADDLIQANLRQLAPLFQQLPNDEAETALLKKLFEIAKKEAPLYNFTKEHEESFNRIVKYRLQEIAELLTPIKNVKNGNFTVKSTIAVIKEYYKFETNSKDNNPYFADFVSAALRTKEFGPLLPRLFNRDFARNMMSKLITSSVQNYRKSYQPGLNQALPLIKEKYFKEEVVNKWFNPKPSIDSLRNDIQELTSDIDALQEKIAKEINVIVRAEKQTKLDQKKEKLELKEEELKTLTRENDLHQQELIDAKNNLPVIVDKIGRLSHDWILFKVKAKGPIIGRVLKFIMKKILGPTADKINRVVITLFNTITGRHAFNELLISKIFHTSVMGINMTTTAVEGTKPLLQIENQLELSRYQIPINQTKAKPFRIHLDAPVVKKPALCKRVGLVVVKKFKAFFKAFSTPTMKLNSKQEQLIQSLQPQIKERKRIVKLPDHVIQARSVQRRNKNFPNKVNPALPGDGFNPQALADEAPELNSSLQKVGDFVAEFSQRTGQELFKQKIRPLTKFIKENVHKLPDQIQQLLDLTSNVIAPLKSTILTRLKQKGYRYELEIDEPVQGLLDVLFKDLRDAKGVIKAQSVEKLRENLRKIKNSDPTITDKDLEDYLETTMSWVTQEYQSKKEIRSLGSFIDEHKKAHVNFHEDDLKASKFYSTAIEWLVRFKIENQVETFQDFLENKLSGIIKGFLDTNIQNFSKLLFNRFAVLINEISDQEYKDLFDQCAVDINKQMENLIKAKENIKGPLNDEQKKQAIAKELVSEEIPGTPKYPLHDLARALLDPPSNLQNEEEIAAYKAAEENKVFLKLVERMLSLALPNGEHNAGGLPQEVNAFQEIWDKLYINPEITNVLEEFRQFLKPLLPAKYADKVDAAEIKVKKLTERFALNIMQKYVTKLMAERLKESFKVISDAEKRKELLANNFQVIEKQLVKSFANMILSKEPKPELLFKRLIEGEAHEPTKQALGDHIWALCSEKFKNSWNKLNITREIFDAHYLPDIYKGLTRVILKNFILSADFKKLYPDLKKLVVSPDDQAARSNLSGALLTAFFKTHKGWIGKTFKNDVSGNNERRCFNMHIHPLIDIMVNEIAEKEKAVQHFNAQAVLSDEDIKTSLEHYFKGENDGNMLYVDIITNVIKMGNFGGRLNGPVAFIVGTEKVRKALTEAIIPAFHPIRASLRNVTELAVEGLKVKYLNDEYIKNLVNPQTLEIIQAKKKRIEEKIEDLKKLNKDLEKGNPKIRENDDKHEKLARKIRKLEDEMVAIQLHIDREPERQLKIQRDFDDGLETMSYLLYDLIEYSIKNATGNGIVNRLANFGHGVANNPEHMHETIKDFYKEIFDNSDLNEALVVNITEKALKLIEEKKV